MFPTSVLSRIRALLPAGAALAALMLIAAPSHAAAENEITVPAERIQGYLQGQFPRDFETLGGLVVVTARDPAIAIPASGDRLQMQFHASAGSPGYAQPLPIGRIHLSSGLRYDPQQQALFLAQPSIDRIVPDRPGEGLDDRSRELVNLWLQDYARNEPLYRLDPSLLANFGTLQVDAVRVENGSVVVQFNQPVGMPDLGAAEADDAQR